MIGTSVVVVSNKGKGGPNIAPQIKKLVEKPLGKQVKVIPFAQYQKGAKKAGLKPKDATLPANAKVLAAGVKASHVLFIEAITEKPKEKKAKPVSAALVTLIDIGTGDVVLQARYELKNKKLDAKVAGLMVTEISGAMAKPAAPPPPPPEEPVAPLEPPQPPPPAGQPVASATEPPPPPPPPAGTTPADGSETQPATPGSEPAVVATTPVSEPAEPAPVIAALSAPAEPMPSLAIQDKGPERRKRWRPALHFGVGGMGLQRTATIKAKNSKPPGYEGPLPGGYMSLAFYPLAIGGRGTMVEGIGVYGDGNFMRVETIVDENTKKAITSDIMGASGGLAYRLVFWDSETAPDFTLKLGYRSFRFPLKEGAFPGTRYGMGTAGGNLTIPFVRQFGLVLGGSYEMRVEAGLKKVSKLGTIKNQNGFRGEGGIRLYFDPIEVIAMGRFEQVTSKYKGATTLTSSSAQYTDVTFTDRYVGGFVTAGVAF